MKLVALSLASLLIAAVPLAPQASAGSVHVTVGVGSYATPVGSYYGRPYLRDYRRPSVRHRGRAYGTRRQVRGRRGGCVVRVVRRTPYGRTIHVIDRCRSGRGGRR